MIEESNKQMTSVNTTMTETTKAETKAESESAQVQEEAEQVQEEAEEKYRTWWAKQEFDDNPLPDSCDCGRIYNCYEPMPCCCTKEMKERKKVCGSCYMTQSRSCHRNCASESGGMYLDRHPVDFDGEEDEQEEYARAPLMNLADMDLFMTIMDYNAAEAAEAAKKNGDTP